MVDDGVGQDGSFHPPGAGHQVAKPETSAAGPMKDKSLEEIDDIIGRIVGKEETERLAAQHRGAVPVGTQEYGLVGWPGESETSSDPVTSSTGASSGPSQNADGSINTSYISIHSEEDHSEQVEFMDVPSPPLNGPPAVNVMLDEPPTEIPAVVISPPPSGDDLAGLQTDRRMSEQSVNGLDVPAIQLASISNEEAQPSSFQGTRADLERSRSDLDRKPPPREAPSTPPPVASTKAAAGSLWQVTLVRMALPDQQSDGHHVGVGVGVEVDKVTGQIVVNQVYSGSSADDNGQIQAGDIILQVNGASATGMAALEVQHMLAGEAMTAVSLLLHRSKHGPTPTKSNPSSPVKANTPQKQHAQPMQGAPPPRAEEVAMAEAEEVAIAEAEAAVKRAALAREQMEADQEAEERRAARQRVLDKRRHSKPPDPTLHPAPPPAPAQDAPSSSYVAFRRGEGAGAGGMHPAPPASSLHAPAEFRKPLPPTSPTTSTRSWWSSCALRPASLLLASSSPLSLPLPPTSPPPRRPLPLKCGSRSCWAGRSSWEAAPRTQTRSRRWRTRRGRRTTR